MRFVANKPGPLQRDIDRFCRLAEKLGCDTDTDRASTGSVYVSVETDEDFPDCRIYRFAGHAECYDSHDYSVLSGGAGLVDKAKREGVLPPGFDGLTADAIEDLKNWLAQAIA